MAIMRYQLRVWRRGFRTVCRGPKSGPKRRIPEPPLNPLPLFPRRLVRGLDNIALLAEAIESGGSETFSRHFDDAIRLWRQTSPEDSDA